jgi:type IV secretion system protein VirB9
MKASAWLLCIPSLFIGTAWSPALTTGAWAETVPPRGKVDSRVRSVAYNPDEVYKVRGYLGYQIDLQFAEGEEFVGMGAGDTGALDAAAERNHLFIKPKQERVGTNLTILTNRRHYHFDYTVLRKPVEQHAEELIYSLRFTYPQDESDRAAENRERARIEERLHLAASERQRNAAYWYCGSPAIRPVSAFDDGVQTHLKFAAQSELPAIFVKNDDKSESLINFNIEHDEVVVHRVARQFVVRRGQLVGCIVNKAFDGGALRLKNGTVSEDVERQTKGAGQ